MRNFIFGALASMFAIVSAHAAPVTYSVMAEFDDGVTANGIFTYDAMSGAFTDINVTASSGEIFQFVNPASAGNAGFLSFSTDAVVTDGVTRYFSAQLDGAMTDMGGTIDILRSLYIGGTGFSFIGTLVDGGANSVGPFSELTTGFVTSNISDVPLPAALPLFLAGLAGIGVMRRKKKAAA